MPRISADLTYFRRWHGNFSVTDNRAVSSTDFNRFSINAPSDSRLPGGGSDTISNLYDVNPARFRVTDNIITFAKNFGRQVRMWNGFATTVTARLVNGLLVQAGVDRGSLTQDTCDLRAALPEIAPVNPYCHTEEPATQFKMLGAYTIPRIALQVSATLQSLPGPDLAANSQRPARASPRRSGATSPPARGQRCR